MAQSGSPELHSDREENAQNAPEDTACTEESDNKSNEKKSVISNPSSQSTVISTCQPRTELLTRTIHYATPTTPEVTLSRYDPLPTTASTSANSCQMPGAWPEKCESIRVSNVDLDSHFEDLKKEFEDKTGRMWIPLEPNKDEGWDWEEDLMYGDLED